MLDFISLVHPTHKAMMQFFLAGFNGGGTIKHGPLSQDFVPNWQDRLATEILIVTHAWRGKMGQRVARLLRGPFFIFAKTT